MSNATFDRVAAEKAKEFVVGLLTAVPELRSATVVFDWYNGLDAALDTVTSVWIERSGPVSDPAAVIGSMRQTVNLLNAQVKRADLLRQAAEAALTEKLKELTRGEGEEGEEAVGGRRPAAG